MIYYTTLYYTTLYYTILHFTILHYTILHYTILHYTILYYTILLGATPTTHRRFILDQEKEKNPSHLVRTRQFKITKIVALADFEPGSNRS